MVQHEQETEHTEESNDWHIGMGGCLVRLFKWPLIILITTLCIGRIWDEAGRREREKEYEYQKNNSGNYYPDQPTEANKPVVKTTIKTTQPVNTQSSIEYLYPPFDSKITSNPDALRRWRERQRELKSVAKQSTVIADTVTWDEIQDYIDSEIENRLDH